MQRHDRAGTSDVLGAGARIGRPQTGVREESDGNDGITGGPGNDSLLGNEGTDRIAGTRATTGSKAVLARTRRYDVTGSS